MGLRHSPAGLTLVKMSCGESQVAGANQSDIIFSAIPGYMEAARGFARLRPATLVPPEASRPEAPRSAHAHPSAAQSPCSDEVGAQSQCNRRQRRLRRCRKLSVGLADSGIDVDAAIGLQSSTESTDDSMRVGRVLPTLTMGHGRPPAQALAELATPGTQFIQHMAPVPVLAAQPGDPPHAIPGQVPKRPSPRPKSRGDIVNTRGGPSGNGRHGGFWNLWVTSWRRCDPPALDVAPSCGCLAD